MSFGKKALGIHIVLRGIPSLILFEVFNTDTSSHGHACVLPDKFGTLAGRLVFGQDSGLGCRIAPLWQGL